MTSFGYENDPKRIAFQLARYLVVAKMLEGKKRVLEVGCADGCGARIVRQHVAHVVAIDVDPVSIQEAKEHASPNWPVDFGVMDIMTCPQIGFDAVYCLDLFEHIADEKRLLQNLHGCAPVCIIGTPSLESQRYASAISKAGHVNCVTKAGLRERMLRHWNHVFMFGMNDTTLHTGHDAMTHYLFGIGVR
jgi:2-polyprenyl-3-methyl-5-hydroxy-6-metoxy-1,4-benzoquinol methylase